MASTLYNNGPGPDYPGEEKEGEILPESSRKATMDGTLGVPLEGTRRVGGLLALESPQGRRDCT